MVFASVDKRAEAVIEGLGASQVWVKSVSRYLLFATSLTIGQFFALSLQGLKSNRDYLLHQSMINKLDAKSLIGLSGQKQAAACTCSIGECKGWESFTEDRWPKGQMQAVGTLRDPDLYQPNAEEHHPSGTRYASPDAPIAVNFFPYNLCDVFACAKCDKLLFRYTEFGGYYVDHRVREVDAGLVV